MPGITTSVSKRSTVAPNRAPIIATGTLGVDATRAALASKASAPMVSKVSAPSRETLMKLTPEAVYAALTTGPITAQARNLTDEEKRSIAMAQTRSSFSASASSSAAALSSGRVRRVFSAT